MSMRWQQIIDGYLTVVQMFLCGLFLTRYSVLDLFENIWVDRLRGISWFHWTSTVSTQVNPLKRFLSHVLSEIRKVHLCIFFKLANEPQLNPIKYFKLRKIFPGKLLEIQAFHHGQLFELITWGASSRWSFRPNSKWGSIETVTMGKTHPTKTLEISSTVDMEWTL